MAKQDLSFDKINSISIYKYEPFWYRISKPRDVSGISSTVSSGIPTSFLYVLDTSYADISSATGYNGGTSTTEFWNVNALDSLSNVLRTTSNPVSIYPGRFLDSSSNSISGNSFNFYLKEPFSSILFKSFINLQSPPIVSPTLPPGISFVVDGSSNYKLTSTPSPSVLLPTTNYQIIGKGVGTDVGKIVTAKFTLSVLNERVLLDLSGTSTVGPMKIGTAITDRQVTARYPPYDKTFGTLSYSWSGLPDGLSFANLSGVAQSSPYTPSDVSSSIVLKGTPTVAAARMFADARITEKTINLTGTRTTAPVISKTQAFTFSFEPSVLFDNVNVPRLFTGVPVDSSASLFVARTYFEAADVSTPIVNIFSPDLRSDLSLEFIYEQQKAYLTGEPYPQTAFNENYTIRAINALDISRSVLQNFTSSDVTVNYDYTITPSSNTLARFIVSSPLSNTNFSNYYSSPIRFKASNNASLPITYTLNTPLPTGISLSNLGGNVVELVGTPATLFPLTNIDISASVTGASTSTSTRLRVEVISDDYTFSNPGSLSFIQNRSITPFQISATTLTQRNVIQYTSTNIPFGLSITNRGIVSGKVTSSTSGSFSVTASTGYTQGVGNFPFTIVPDRFLLFVSDTRYLNSVDYFNYFISPGTEVSIPIRGISFSGIPVNQFSIVDTDPPSCPFLIDSTTGVMTAKTGVYVPPSTADSPYTYTILGWSSTTSTSLTPAAELVMTLSVPIGDEPSILQFSTSPVGGPLFTQPNVKDYLMYQYVPITPITLSASGSGPIRMFVAVEDLPIGLTFDPATQTISGRPVDVGYDEVIVYAQDVNLNYTYILLKFTTVVPSVVRQQTSAGGYTSLLRQYTNVNAAQNARDNRVFPTAERSLGEFMSPQAPDVVTEVPPCLK